MCSSGGIDGEARSADVVALMPLRLIKLRVTPLPLDREAASLPLPAVGGLSPGTSTVVLHCRPPMRRPASWMPWPIWLGSTADDPQSPPRWPSWKLPSLLLARETASRTLSKLRSRGTVVENGHLCWQTSSHFKNGACFLEGNGVTPYLFTASVLCF